jgi:hypothetical protein
MINPETAYEIMSLFSDELLEIERERLDRRIEELQVRRETVGRVLSERALDETSIIG